ncbi:orotidine-5'-phosphate decarboxylase [Alteromonas ponticola]|uniref:Orotidine 5'-phosphate decarboxylase n=1 Tax=Alteromonas aquimaris TaxID=2998417 RepID=A0ABT3P5Q9_9ALTE|nr:orotidine-5'-phosphate decarboxylase [Alteromonas aquimaris]MCW8108099.1 orotidine-5'-phosphate decarboxylase [Alteromonas aquimaris]
MNQDPKVIVALDFDTKEEATALVAQLDPSECKLKVGKEMFTLFGPDFVKLLIAKGFDIFLDLKFHDIPNTVAKACKAAAELGVWMVNVHASGGLEMMQKAKQAIADSTHPETKLIAVTVLTSMDAEQLAQVVPAVTPAEQVTKLATLANQAGLDGVVCSAQEAKLLRDKFAPDFLLVTPGIRPAGSDKGDQKRVMTPAMAMKSGVSYLVMGRPITQSGHPLETLKQVNKDIA